MKIEASFFGLMATLFLVGTVSAQPQSTSNDDLAKQIAELRAEVQALRNELRQMSKAVADIHRVAVRPPAPPEPAVERLSLDDDPVLGSADAKLAIVEFSDYQCPYCRRFHDDTFPKLKATYLDTGKVRFVFRDFPLSQIHPKARDAAIAASCGGKQDAYWKMHDSLFDQQARLGPELYTELAQSFGLDLARFQSCLGDPATAQEVDSDLAFGESVGIRGVPHYFVGRLEGGEVVKPVRINGAQPFEAFQQVIDELLKPAKPGN